MVRASLHPEFKHNVLHALGYSIFELFVLNEVLLLPLGVAILEGLPGVFGSPLQLRRDIAEFIHDVVSFLLELLNFVLECLFLWRHCRGIRVIEKLVLLLLLR